MTFLLDCSHYQGSINWAQVKADGCVGAYVKTTDGATGVDAMWQNNHAGASGVGLPVGPYHFAEGGNPSAEAAHFASIWSAGWQLHPTLDYEIAGVNAGWLVAFRSVFRADTGFNAFRVYASEGNLTGPLNPAGWLDAATTIWAARYAGSLGWSSPALVLWQNTSTASVPGIVGNVDQDQFMNGWTPATDQGGTVTGPVDLTPDAISKVAQATLNEIMTAPLARGTVAGDPTPGGQTGNTALNAVLSYYDSNNAALAAKIEAEVGTEITAEETAVLAAVQGVTAGTVNVTELAQALVPILAPADATAFQAALAAALAK